MTLDRMPGGMKKGRSINAWQVGRALNRMPGGLKARRSDTGRIQHNKNQVGVPIYVPPCVLRCFHLNKYRQLPLLTIFASAFFYLNH
jgi:hypothetical protein